MKGHKIYYSDDELSFLSNNRDLSRAELHAKFCHQFKRSDVCVDNIKSLCTRKGWKTGRTGRFEKGHIPHPDAKPKGANKTSFKKGNTPHNWKPVGSTRTTVDGYIEIKTQEPKKWEQLHKVIWTEAYGEIPEGCCVVFKDSDKSNVVLDNLELVSRNELLQINRLRCTSYPSEVQPTVRSLGKLKAKIGEVENEQQ